MTSTIKGDSNFDSDSTVLQIVDLTNAVNSTLSAINQAADDTIPQITEGGLLVSGSFTPKSATSTLYLDFEGNCDSSGNTEMVVSLFKTGTADALNCCTHYSSIVMDNLSCKGSVASVGTTAITLSARVMTMANVSLYLNGDSVGRKFGGKLAQRLRIIEVSG